MRLRLRKRKRGQSWEDERERKEKMGQCESLRERDEKVERRPAAARCTFSLSFISANVFTISL